MRTPIVLAATGHGDPDAGAAFVFAAAANMVLYVGLLVCIGAAVFVALIQRGDRRRRRRAAGVALGGAVIGGLAAIVSTAARATSAAGEPAAAADLTAWASVLATTPGVGLLVGVAGMAVIAVAVVAVDHRWASAVALLGAAVAVAYFPLTGHAVTGEPRWLAGGAACAHGTASAIWVGGLAALTASIGRAQGDLDALAQTVRRFSAAALWAVAVVALTGLVIGWVHVGTPGELVASGYGLTLVAKVGLTAGIIAIGAYNRYWLVPATERGGRRSLLRLRRTVTVELIGLLAVVVATAALVETPPPTGVA